MYAAHKKNINRHKSFHPLTGQNLEKIEKKQAEQEQRDAQVTERKATLRRERDEDLIADLEDASSGVVPTKGPRVDWMFAAEQTSSSLATSTVVATKPTATETATVGSVRTDTAKGGPSTAATTTGAVTAAELLKARQEVEQLRKLKRDPLAKVQQHRRDVVGSVAKGMGSSSTTPINNDVSVQARLQALLNARSSR